MRRWLLALMLFVSLATGARADVTDHYVLLMVWMPGLCKFEPDRRECKDLTLRRYDGLNLAFMALQSARPSNAANTFCYTMLDDEDADRSKQWCDMYQPKIPDTLTLQLKTLMPVMQSCQDRASGRAMPAAQCIRRRITIRGPSSWPSRSAAPS